MTADNFCNQLSTCLATKKMKEGERKSNKRLLLQFENLLRTINLFPVWPLRKRKKRKTQTIELLTLPTISSPRIKETHHLRLAKFPFTGKVKTGEDKPLSNKNSPSTGQFPQLSRQPNSKTKTKKENKRKIKEKESRKFLTLLLQTVSSDSNTENSKKK